MRLIRIPLVFVLAILALAVPRLSAQTTTVSATIIDPAGTHWGNSSWTATVISSLNPPVTFPGYNNFTTTLSGQADSTGLFMVNVQRVANIYPAGSTWQFCVVSGVSYTQKFCVSLPIGNSGQSTQDISAQINAIITVPVIPGGIAVRAYTDAEVPAVIGAIYFNVVQGTFRCFASSWVNCGSGGGGGGGFPFAQQVAAGKGDGTGVAMPEKPVTVVGTQAFVAADEDVANGRFDCRNPVYAGGCLGQTPGAAMQAFSDQLACYQGTTGQHARTTFPPMRIAVGTPTQPTLKLPTGAIYEGAGGWGFASTATTFQATYNGHTVIEFDNGLIPSPGAACITTLTSVATQSGGLTTYTGTVPGGASNALAGRSYIVAGFTNSANNGTYSVAASSATSITLHNTAGVAETDAATASPVSGLGGGSYDGFAVHGCGQGGCVNVPGDSGNYPFGGPTQVGIVFHDSDASIAQKAGVFANNNGSDGIIEAGGDSHVFHIGGAANNDYFYFGLDQAGQNYQFTNPNECHGEINLSGLDDMNEGPFETYGTFMTLGSEYGHVAGVCWGGGLTNLGPIFSQIEEIGLIHAGGGSLMATVNGGRIDAPRGEGIYERGGGRTSYMGTRIISACRFNGASDNIVSSVAVATPGSGQTPNTYLLTGSDGTSQISVTVGGDGTVATNPVVTVHARGLSSTPPTYTLAAGGTPATFTVTMMPVFMILHPHNGFSPFTACDYVFDNTGGGNTFNTVQMQNNGFFGASFATGDALSIIGGDDWIGVIGNAPNGTFLWEPSPALRPTGFGQRVIQVDPAFPVSTPNASGATFDIPTVGHHIVMGNTSPVTLTSITGASIMDSLSIVGDGFTTMPYLSFGQQGQSFFGFGVTSCAHYPTLLERGRIYNYIVTNFASATLPNLTELCPTIDQRRWDVNWLANSASLPPLENQGTLDVIGTTATHALPVLARPGGQAGGIPGPNGIASINNYVFVVWVGGGKMVSPLSGTFSQCLPLPGFVNNPCFQNVQFSLPEGWTRYQLYRNTATDSVATVGMIFDSGFASAPQPAQAAQWEDTRIAPINGNTIPSGWYSAAATGTFSNDGMTIPTGSSFPGIPGQTIIDQASHSIYKCDTDDHWLVSVIPAFNAF